VSRIRRLLQKALTSPRNVRFAEALKLAEAFGFRVARISGSHHILVHPGLPELLNLQDVGGRAKPYQLAQLLKLAERYNLQLGDER
jgi:hypothetical protein